MNIHLTDKKCVACEGGIPPLTREQIATYQPEVPEWNVSDDGLSISRKFIFKNFKEAITFADKVGELAEEEGHHPVLTVQWGKVSVFLTTDAINGLSENDFILAAKVDRIT
ncbi:4a-hydroxytetrahydrobiopterin dehydratase [Patescibacteria group bacterium]|nr:4a-hydroxytetrahydrobiopterin dehydratase [Patescibacteria group bacterium]